MDYKGQPYEGLTTDGTYAYSSGGGIVHPNAGTVYSGGQWISPAQYAQNKAAAAQAGSSIAQSGVANVASNKLNTLLTDPSSVSDTPGYKFAFNQGLEGVNRTAAAKGMLGSGNRLYDLTKFGQGLASTTYNDTLRNLGNFVNKTPMTAASTTPGTSYTTSTSSSNPVYYNLGGVY